MKLHYINLAPGGRFRPTGNFETTPKDVDAIVAAIDKSPKRKVVVHFHGGLVDEARGMTVAREMTALYDGTAHSVSIMWETGALEILAHKLSDVWQTKLFQTLARLAIKHVANKLHIDVDGGRGGNAKELDDAAIERVMFEGAGERVLHEGARGAADVLDLQALPILQAELEAEIDADIALHEDAIARAVDEAAAEQPIPVQPALIGAKGGAGARGATLLAVGKFAVQIVMGVVKRYLAKRDHGFYPTVVEETLRAAYLADFGAWAWSGMKESAEKMWAGHDGPASAQLAGGTYFIDQLLKLNPPPTIDLVGHSAGSIAICHLLESLERRKVPLAIRNVSFLAPACRHDLFLKTVVPAVAKQRVASFRMFTMKDELEKQDALINAAPAVYPRSLLYLVSGVFETVPDDPILGMQRFLFQENASFVNGFADLSAFLTTSDRLVLSATDAAAVLGMRAEANDHGAFDQDRLMLESLKHLASQ